LLAVHQRVELASCTLTESVSSWTYFFKSIYFE